MASQETRHFVIGRKIIEQTILDIKFNNVWYIIIQTNSRAITVYTEYTTSDIY